jgi:hypothetical protein
MRDAQDEADEVPSDDVLAEVSHHVLFRGKKGCDVHVYHILNGPRADTFWAIPKLLWRPSHKDFFGKGNTEEEALQDCLRKSRGIPIDRMFPRPGPGMVDGDAHDVVGSLL